MTPEQMARKFCDSQFLDDGDVLPIADLLRAALWERDAAHEIALKKARADALDAAIALAVAVAAEQEEQWENAGGEEGSPSGEWFRDVPAEEWARQTARYSGSGGADACDEVALRLRALLEEAGK